MIPPGLQANRRLLRLRIRLLDPGYLIVVAVAEGLWRWLSTKARPPLASAPVVECHPLQCGSLQNRHVTTIFVGNRQKGLRQPTARFVHVDHIVTEVAGDFGPGGIEGLSDRLQGLWAERCPIDEMPSLCLSLSAHSYYPASFEMVWW